MGHITRYNQNGMYYKWNNKNTKLNSVRIGCTRGRDVTSSELTFCLVQEKKRGKKTEGEKMEWKGTFLLIGLAKKMERK